jgi:hypothetical protein
MVYFRDQHIIFPAEFQFYISNLTLALFLLVIAVLFVGVMINKLCIVIRMQNEILRVGDRAQARKIEGKKE